MQLITVLDLSMVHVIMMNKSFITCHHRPIHTPTGYLFWIHLTLQLAKKYQWKQALIISDAGKIYHMLCILSQGKNGVNAIFICQNDTWKQTVWCRIRQNAAAFPGNDKNPWKYSMFYCWKTDCMLGMMQNATLSFSTSKAFYVTKRMPTGKSEYINSMLQN